MKNTEHRTPDSLTTSESGSSNQFENTSESNLEKNPSKIEHEFDNPEKKIYSYRTKAIYLTLMAFAGLMGPLASGMNIPALGDMAEYFETDYSKVSLTVTYFLVSIAIFPLFWSVLADAYGRRWFILASMIIFTLSSIVCAFSTSVEMLIIFRVLQGLGSSAALVISIGVIADIFPKDEMGRAVGFCSIGMLIGPVFGPIIGGYMTQYLGWKSLFYLCAGLGGVLVIFMALIYRETIDPSVKLPSPIIRNDVTGKLEFSKVLPNPFGCLIFLKYIDVTLLCIISSFVFGCYFANEIAQPITVGVIYQLSTSQVGLSFTATGAGNLFGSIGTGFISDYMVKRYVRMNNGKSSPPKLRLYVVLIGSVLVIPALLMNGWFINNNYQLGAVLFSQFLLGLSMTNIVSGVMNYYIEAFPGKSSSVTACNTTIRIIFGAITSKVTPNMLSSVGVGYTFTIYAGFEILSLLILIFMIYFGSKIGSIERN
ncbi:MFS general substrate transporter [Conidiobolus coronatus NRRL 28638]|uniref:MFS general substrate transporter n=1 Tax=Conidiobolus coronatus (strain ATCC 28846 / CBS 209.66 / NRRL 28638) TaxID=796925 RepID=A0A137P2E5_CONC2|nr:MFS general substrate transporter [Conidiobolus coronatus NRRL 28638]|eukprot:KXN69216.1 MFS general substrate transporter [Conidiobolus coronatus NRRL 28638]